MRYEAAVESVEAVSVSDRAARVVNSSGIITDKLAIFFSISLSKDGSLVTLLKEFRTVVVNKVGINPDYIIPVDKKIIPKTSLGNPEN